MARIDLSLEDAKNSAHVGTSPSFIQGTCNDNVKSKEGGNMKLPKLELKSFSGNYEEWQSFWDTFESAVNRNTNISRIQKFTYLKSCVTGAGESAISGLPVTEDNYETAIDILRDRFGKPQLLISNHMEALLKLPIVSSVHETKNLRDLYDKIEINIRSLKALGVESESVSSSCDGESSF